MTSSASGSGPRQWPSQAEAASIPTSSQTSNRRGEALLAGIGNPHLLPLAPLARRRARIPGHVLGAEEFYARAKTDSTGIRRKYHLYGSRRRLRRRHQGRAPVCRARSRSLLLCRSVFERRQLARALRNHGERNLAANRRTRHAFRRYARNYWYLRRHHASFERVKSKNSLHLAAAGLRLPRHRRREALALGNHAAHLRFVRRRRKSGDRARRRARHGPATGPGTGE